MLNKFITGTYCSINEVSDLEQVGADFNQLFLLNSQQKNRSFRGFENSIQAMINRESGGIGRRARFRI